MTMLSESECERVRYHLGYMATTFGSEQAAASMAFGMPKPAQTIFLVEQAIKQLLTNPYAVDRVRSILNTLDDIEKKLQAATCTLIAEKVGDITLRGAEAGKTFPDLLEREYKRWACRLADVLGVPFYPFSTRFSRRGPGSNFTVS